MSRDIKKDPGNGGDWSFFNFDKFPQKNRFEDQIFIAGLGVGTKKDESIIFQKDIDFKQLKATMEAAKKAEEQIQKTGELAYQQVVIGFVKMG